MKYLFSNIKIEINNKLYVKDPESSDLGKKIIEQAILLINEIGFESFTFKKLGAVIGSNESSIYRYFENKHKLLLYLVSWYWSWKEYYLVFATNNILETEKKLSKAIDVLTRPIEEDSAVSHINEVVLYEVVVNEYSKSFLKNEVDKEIKEGMFSIYNRLIIRLKDIILEVSPKYEFAASLSSLILEGALHQHFLKDHFPSLTACNKNTDTSAFFKHMVLSTLNSKFK